MRLTMNPNVGFRLAEALAKLTGTPETEFWRKLCGGAAMPKKLGDVEFQIDDTTVTTSTGTGYLLPNDTIKVS